jgi:glyoxylase-like metal-dependent hydrolase (beta-lactamase superfamily II)
VPSPAFVDALGDGIYAIDTGFYRPRFDAAYLIVDSGRAAFIDTGTNFAVPRLLAALAHAGLAPADVDWVIPTHVHLDHAGGAGLLMRALPAARMAIHPLGAPHMVDPGALQAGSTAIYGAEEMARSYGELVPVDEARITALPDGASITLGRRPLAVMHTPGHARHHFCVWDERSRWWFTGDTFGQSYAEIRHANGRFIVPSSTPVQFDPEALKHSITRLLKRDPAGMCLTHYGVVGDVQRLGGALIEQIDEMAALGQRHRRSAHRLQSITAGLEMICRRRLREHGFDDDVDDKLSLMTLDIELNAAGIVSWLERLERAQRRPA